MSEEIIKKRILVIEDDLNLGTIIKTFLDSEGNYEVTVEQEPMKVLRWIEEDSFDFDLILTDIGLPEISGKEMLRKLRSNPNAAKIPVIVITGFSQQEEEKECLNLGADDFIRKPFHSDIFLARIKTVLRRTYSVEGKPGALQRGAVVIDSGQRNMKVRGKLIPLTSTEFNFVYYLAQRNEAVDTRTLLDRIWGLKTAKNKMISTRRVQAHVDNIRAKLGDYAGIIVTIPRFGYKFDWEPASRQEPVASEGLS